MGAIDRESSICVKIVKMNYPYIHVRLVPRVESLAALQARELAGALLSCAKAL